MSDAVRPTLADTWPARTILTALQDTGEVFILFGHVIREIPAGARKVVASMLRSWATFERRPSL